jgi:pyruvate dehydrogenase E2 component (dihydrolipoamide acetyltransferase)
MAFSVVMPALEMAQETGTLISWRKKEGDNVSKGEPLLEIETDKAIVEVEAPADGILAGVGAQEGAVIPVGEIIAWIIRPGEAVPAKSAARSNASTNHEPASIAHRSVDTAAQTTTTTGTRLSPKARRLAREAGIDPSQLRGSGPGGAVLAADVAPESMEGPPNLVTPSSIARIMAERTTQSWTTVPHFFVARDVDASSLVAAHKQLKSKPEFANARPTFTDLLVALVARVLEKHPRMNASWVNGKIRLNRDINVAVAIAVDDAVAAPVIHKASSLPLAQISAQIRALSERARTNRLHPEDISGATFTISNLGMYQVDAFSAIINSPQAGILAVGSITDRVVALNGEPAVRPMMTLTLSCDHRVVDGARAALFLRDLVEALHAPDKLL